jgi:hypothetical protein
VIVVNPAYEVGMSSGGMRVHLMREVVFSDVSVGTSLCGRAMTWCGPSGGISEKWYSRCQKCEQINKKGQ